MREDEQLIGQLREAVRKDDVLADPRWEALASGQLDAEQEHAFRKRLADAGIGNEAVSAFKPLDEEAEQKLATLALHELKKAEKPAAHTVEPAPTASSPPRSQRRVSDAVVVVLTLVTVSLLVFWPDVSSLRDEVGPSLEVPHVNLPSYAVHISPVPGLLFFDRSPHPDIYNNEIFIFAQPGGTVEGPVNARAFLLRDGRAHHWKDMRPHGRGGVDFEGHFGNVQGGRWELVVVIGRPGELPDEQDITASLPKESGRLRVIRQWIELPQRAAPAHSGGVHRSTFH